MAFLKWNKKSSTLSATVAVDEKAAARWNASNTVYAAPQVVIVDPSSPLYDSDEDDISITALPLRASRMQNQSQNRHSKSLSMFKQFYNNKEGNNSAESVAESQSGRRAVTTSKRTSSEDSIVSSSSFYSSSSYESTSTLESARLSSSFSSSSSSLSATKISLTEIHNHVGHFYYPAFTSTSPTSFFLGRSKTHEKKTVWECPAIEIDPPALDDIPQELYTPSIPARTLKHSKAKVPAVEASKPMPTMAGQNLRVKLAKTMMPSPNSPATLLTTDKLDESRLSVSWVDAAGRAAQAQKEARARVLRAQAAAQRVAAMNAYSPANFRPPNRM